MSDFPDTIFEQRAINNIPGMTYDPNKKTTVYAEDITKLGAEVTAIETYLDENPPGGGGGGEWTEVYAKHAPDEEGEQTTITTAISLPIGDYNRFKIVHQNSNFYSSAEQLTVRVNDDTTNYTTTSISANLGNWYKAVGDLSYAATSRGGGQDYISQLIYIDVMHKQVHVKGTATCGKPSGITRDDSTFSTWATDPRELVTKVTVYGANYDAIYMRDFGGLKIYGSNV